MNKKMIYFLFPAIALVCVVISVFFPVLFVPLTLVGSVCFAVACATNKSPVLPLSAVFLFLAMLLIFRSSSLSMLYLAVFLPVGASVGVAYRYKSGLNKTISIIMIVSSLFFLLLCVVFIFETSPRFSVQEALEPFKSMVKEVSDSIYTELAKHPELQKSVPMVQQMLALGKEGYASEMFKSLAYQAPIVLAMAALVLGVLSFYSVKKILGKLGYEVGFMTRFDSVRVSRTGGGAYILSYLIATLLSFSGTITPMFLIFYVFSTVMCYVMAFNGLSLICALIKSKGIGRFSNILILIFITVLSFFISFIPPLLAMFGVLDSFSDFRSRLGGTL